MFENLFDPVINVNVTGLTEELKAIYVYNLFQKQNRSILLVTNSLYEANLFYHRLNLQTEDVFLFPMDDFLTSEALAVSPEFLITRLETLYETLKNKRQIIITNLMGYLRFLPQKSIFEQSILLIKKNMDYSIKDLVEKLFYLGYVRQTLVSKTGDLAVRGFVIDLFPVTASLPIRIEFWGDTIESIRTFDLDTQRTMQEIDQIEIFSNTEFLSHKDIPFEMKKQKNLILYETSVNITSFLDDPIVVFDQYQSLCKSYEDLQKEIFEYNLSISESPDKIYMHDFKKILSKDFVYFHDFDEVIPSIENKCFSSYLVETFPQDTLSIQKRLYQYLKKYDYVVLCFKDRYQLNKAIDYIALDELVVTNERELFIHKINVIIKNLKTGFLFENYAVISDQELFHKRDFEQKYKTNFKLGSKIKDITKLNLGDYIVHYLYGIGRYVGIVTLNKNGLKKDYLQLSYKNDDKLYVPVEKIDIISKYSGSDGSVPKLNSLSSNEWEKTKLKAKKRIEDMASKLLSLYASREALKGFSFQKDTEEQLQFEKDFAYEETIDQLRVIEEIKKDMESSHPMDRLLCGDVGYGKTEIAFRAIFKAIMSGKQAALLCPTTILSNQHYQTAIERFRNFPVNIALLNRFVTKKETEQLLKKLKEGKIDLLIGTHRILSDDILFFDLGILVIDEEQRFGVKHKEKIKQYKNNIDVLTLSATPIPRTLQMSMAGIRSLSLLETPPVDRYPIQTYVLASNDRIIKEAIYKELSRNGQVFILYNRIEDMDRILKHYEKLVPTARIVIAHGKMGKDQIEKVMMGFINKEYDVLLCTTIIETGIDIPNVNTLIIMDANHFGLSQLYQIRGRVGRSNKIAYCYLMYEKDRSLTETAVKRLKVIKEFTELGSGFNIAMRDLSIRGAGDLLGGEQSGFIDTIGIELFMKMLEEEIARLQNKEVKKIEVQEKPLLEVTTTIEDSYVQEEDLKIYIHKKINEINSYEKLMEIKEELEDRFGEVTEDMLIYMHEEWFEKMAQKLNISQIKQNKNSVEITLSKEITRRIDGEILFQYVNNITRFFRFSLKNDQLIITLDLVKLEKHFIYYLVDFLKVLKDSFKPLENE